MLALSPHLDDAVFSAGGTLAALGADVTLVTAFTLSVPRPTGFALACQTDKGLERNVDYMALRRAEDRRAADVLGVRDVVHLPLAEAPHRGYDCAPALFGALRADDEAAEDLRAHLAGLVPADLVLVPLGLGDHVDHRQLRRALGLRGRPSDPPPVGPPLALGPPAAWRDTPYVLRAPDAGPLLAAVPLPPEALERKLDACAAYRSQLGFQFGGETSMRAALTQLAHAEGERLAAGGPAEGFAGRAAARAAAAARLVG